MDFPSFTFLFFFSSKPSHLTSSYLVHFNVIFFGFHFLAFKFDLLLSSGFLFLFLSFSSVSFDFPFVAFLRGSFILFFIFLIFFPMLLVLSSAN